MNMIIHSELFFLNYLILFKVYVGDQLCGTIEYHPLKYSYEVLCNGGNGFVGHTVKIVNDHTHLTLCEVKVIYSNNFKLMAD